MTDPVANVETVVKADVTAEFDEVKVALAADIVKARAVMAKFGIAFAALVVGWILGKLF